MIEPARVRIQEIRTQGTVGNYGSGGIAEMLKDTVKIIKDKVDRAENCSTCFLLKQGGYDTHSNQVSNLTGNLEKISQAISGARTDLINAGVWDQSVILVGTEFGRTLRHNGDAFRNRSR